MSVAFGNIFYFLPILIAVLIAVAGALICHKKGERFTRIFVLVVYLISFAIHFLMALTPYYQIDMPLSLAHIALPVLCGVYAVFAPFLFWFGKGYAKDYLFYIGLLSFVGTYLNPTTPTGLGTKYTFADSVYLWEVIRYYACHLALLVGPVCMLAGGCYRISYRRLWALPLTFAGAMGMTVVNAIVFSFVVKHPWFPTTWYGPDGIFNRFATHAFMANKGYAMGPDPSIDPYVKWLYPFLIPGLQYYYSDGQMLFTPVVWTLPLTYFVVIFVFLPIVGAIDHKQVHADFLAIKAKIAERRQKKG